ncbi:hypothetical protein B0H13DRAFT_1947442 [Mycena leptocephala]|nr:hypothetical protein B0H13DRAFT_1947442 [Mycena leptocephala]
MLDFGLPLFAVASLAPHLRATAEWCLSFAKPFWTSQSHNYAHSDKTEEDESAIHAEWPQLQHNASKDSVRQCGAALADDRFTNRGC